MAIRGSAERRCADRVGCARRSAPILRVCHDADDGAWQFLHGGPVSEEDAAVVGLGRMLERDPSLRELADLPEGWIAERADVGSAWMRVRR
jgi:hypothetical protein